MFGKTYPNFILDSKRISKLRKKCQKPREQEEILSWYVLRPVSIYITIVCIKLNIKANIVSYMSLFLFLLAGLFMIRATLTSFLFASGCYIVGYLMDCVDGEIARLKNTTSNYGFFLDTLIRATSIPIFIAIFLAFLNMGNYHITFWVSLYVYLITIIATYSLLIPISYVLVNTNHDQLDPVAKIRRSSILNECIAFISGYTGFFTIIIMIVIIDRLTFNGILTKVYLLLFISIFSIKTLIRYFLTIKALK